MLEEGVLLLELEDFYNFFNLEKAISFLSY